MQRKQYIKNKQQYSELKQQIGRGIARKLDIDFGIITHQTLGDCVKELIDVSYDIY